MESSDQKNKMELHTFATIHKNVTWPPLNKLPAEIQQQFMDAVNKASKAIADLIDKDILESYLRKP